jgi:hydroxymethylbilane synthase
VESIVLKPPSTTLSVKVGARGSPLARAQVAEVLKELRRFHPDVTFETTSIETIGDRDQTTSLRTLERSDFFTREIDQLLLAGGCQVAIHSAKDLPDPLPDGIVLVALTRGVDSADALVFNREPFPGAKIGTSSIRREEIVRALYPGAECLDIRGTIEQRLALLDRDVVDGVVIAEAALIRLGLTGRKRIKLSGDTALNQGRLAILAREGDEAMRDLFSCLNKKVLYLGTEKKEGTVHYPVIRVEMRPFDNPEMKRCFGAMEQYTHIVITSKHAADFFLRAVAHFGCCLKGKQMVAVGKATAQQLGMEAWVAEDESQEGIVEMLKAKDLKSSHFFLPRSSRARNVIDTFLQQSGIPFTPLDLYDTIHQQPDPIPDLSPFDEIIFSSPSTVEAFLKIYGALPRHKQLTPIGPITKQALEDLLE